MRVSNRVIASQASCRTVLRRWSQCSRRPAWGLSGLPARQILVCKARWIASGKLRRGYCLPRTAIVTTAKPVTHSRVRVKSPLPSKPSSGWLLCPSCPTTPMSRVSALRSSGATAWPVMRSRSALCRGALMTHSLFSIPRAPRVCPSALCMALAGRSYSTPRSMPCTQTSAARTGFSTSRPVAG